MIGTARIVHADGMDSVETEYLGAGRFRVIEPFVLRRGETIEINGVVLVFPQDAFAAPGTVFDLMKIN